LGLPLIERKALLESLVADKLGLQFNGHETGDGELILKHAGKLGFEGVVSKDDRCALRAGESRPMAQSQSAKPPGVRRRRLVRPRRITATSRSAASRILHRRRQAYLRWTCRDRDARQGSCRSAAATGPDRSEDIASERPAAAPNSLRIADAPTIPRSLTETACASPIVVISKQRPSRHGISSKNSPARASISKRRRPDQHGCSRPALRDLTSRNKALPSRLSVYRKSSARWR
jgi:hypothetical protein